MDAPALDLAPLGPLGPAAIRRLLPHQGAMCVLDAVLACDADHIVCRAIGHRAATHPMRGPHGLGSACGIEYAAQAMALHAALSALQAAGDAPPARLPAGRLASVRDVLLQVATLHDIDEDLEVSAQLLSGDPRSAMYAFALRAGQRPLVSGRASVLIRPAA